MRVLVTGSSGFIGSALIEDLRAGGVDAHGLDIRAPRWRKETAEDHRVDLNDGEALKSIVSRLRPERVVHLAARTDLSKDSVVRYNTNIDGVAHLVRAVQQVGSVSRVLWTSTQLVSRVGRAPAFATDYAPDTSYGESKVIGERIVRGLDGGGVTWALLRPTTVWGPGMSDHYLGLLRYLELGHYFHAGRAPTPKSFSYVHNAIFQIRALLDASDAQVHRQTFYIADDQPIDMRGWCDALSAELGRPPSPVVPVALARLLARGGDLLNRTVAPAFKFNTFRLRNIMTPYVFDTSNLRAIVGPLPHTLEQAICATVAWYRQSASRQAMPR